MGNLLFRILSVQAVTLHFDSLVASKKALKMMQAFSICELNSINLMEWRESFCSVLSWEILWHSGHLPSSPYCLFMSCCESAVSSAVAAAGRTPVPLPPWQLSVFAHHLVLHGPSSCAGLLRAPGVSVMNNDNKICQQWTTWPCKSLAASASVSSLENSNPHVCIILSSLYCLSQDNIGQQPYKSTG